MMADVGTPPREHNLGLVCWFPSRGRAYVLPVILAGACLCLAATACRKDQPSDNRDTATRDTPWFTEIASEAGLRFAHTTGHRDRFWMPEIVTGGVGILDYDGDGFQDVYFVQGGSVEAAGKPATPGNKLFRNLTAEGILRFEDVTDSAGVGDNGYGMGCCTGDYDNDGDMDLYVTNLGANVLYRNTGRGAFVEATQGAGVGDTSWGVSCAFLDYDQDGFLDLFITNYLSWSPRREVSCHTRAGRPDYCSPMNYTAPAKDTLYRNNGNGTFANVTEAAGITEAFGNGLGVACGDFSGDGRPDIYVANDAMPNQLWVNRGDGTFEDQAMIRGCAVNGQGLAEAGMGVVAVDLQQDGLLDLFMSHLVEESNTFYVNRGAFFEDMTPASGLAAPSWRFTGFGIAAADFDLDGLLDVYIANGRVRYGHERLHPDDHYAEPDQLFRGLGDARFAEVKPQGGVAKSQVAAGRGAALGDFDNDGRVDIAIVNRDGPAQILHNVAEPRGHWIMFRVLNRYGSDAVGSRLRIEAGAGVFWREVQTSGSFSAANDPRVHCGLASATRVDRVTVHWPGGEKQSFGPFEADRIHELRRDPGNR